MDKIQLQEEVNRLEKELEELEGNRDKLNASVKKDTVFTHGETKDEIELFENEIKQKKLILKEFKERLRSS